MNKYFLYLVLLLAGGIGALLIPQEIDTRGRNVDRPFGEINIPEGQAPIGAPITAGVYVAASAPAQLDDHYLFDSPQAGRLRYIGTERRDFTVHTVFSGTSSVNNKLFSFRFGVNGVTIPETQIDRFIGTGADVAAGALTAIIELEQNDYVELFVTIDSGTTTATATHVTVMTLAVQ